MKTNDRFSTTRGNRPRSSVPFRWITGGSLAALALLSSCGPLPKGATTDIMDRPDGTLAGDVPITPIRVAR